MHSNHVSVKRSVWKLRTLFILLHSQMTVMALSIPGMFALSYPLLEIPNVPKTNKSSTCSNYSHSQNTSDSLESF